MHAVLLKYWLASVHWSLLLTRLTSSVLISGPDGSFPSGFGGKTFGVTSAEHVKSCS